MTFLKIAEILVLVKVVIVGSIPGTGVAFHSSLSTFICDSYLEFLFAQKIVKLVSNPFLSVPKNIFRSVCQIPLGLHNVKFLTLMTNIVPLIYLPTYLPRYLAIGQRFTYKRIYPQFVLLGRFGTR